MMIKVARITLW